MLGAKKFPLLFVSLSFCTKASSVTMETPHICGSG